MIYSWVRLRVVVPLGLEPRLFWTKTRRVASYTTGQFPKGDANLENKFSCGNTQNIYLLLRLFIWRGVRVVERASLESLYTGNCIVGSNPTLSAKRDFPHKKGGVPFLMSTQLFETWAIVTNTELILFVRTPSVVFS